MPEIKSARFEMRIPPALLKRIRREAKADKQDASEYIRSIIENHFLRIDSENFYASYSDN
jgi:predicted DNA binding CopG/RHH family protein